MSRTVHVDGLEEAHWYLTKCLDSVFIIYNTAPPYVWSGIVFGSSAGVVMVLVVVALVLAVAQQRKTPCVSIDAAKCRAKGWWW